MKRYSEEGLSIKQIDSIDLAIALTTLAGWNIPEHKERLLKFYSLEEYNDILWGYKYHFENERKD